MLQRFAFILLISFLFFGFSSNQKNQDRTSVFEGYPVPTDKNMLFYIQKSFNTNAVVYAANIGEDGKLDPKKPVKVFWRRYQEDGRKRELKYLERKLGFGVNSKPVKGKDNTYILRLVSLKKMSLVITQNKKGKPVLITRINKKPAYIKRVFVTAEHKNLLPKVFFVEIFGKELKTGKFLYEKFDN